MYEYVLFDLDGTLMDPKEEIKETKIYPGIEQLLYNLKERGVRMAIVADKPQEVIERILKDFEIETYFSVVAGCEKDGMRENKEEVLEEAISRMKKKAGRRWKKEKILLVGDRKFDVEAATQMGIASVAVTYGYAPEGELVACEPDYMADSAEQLEEIITGEPLFFKYRNKNAFAKTLEILVPFLLFWAVELLVYNAGYVVVKRYLPVLAEDANQLSVWLNAIAAISTWPMLAKLYAGSYAGDTSHVITRRNRALIKKEAVLVSAYAIALGLGLNMLATWFQIFRISGGYEQVAGIQYSVPLSVGLVIYGILTPFTEEVVFRGIIYNRIRKYFPLPVTMFASALIFGCFHGNIVQIIYATVMGMALALVYEVYGRNLIAPVLFHCSANVIVYLLSKGNAFPTGKVPIFYGVALLTVALGITCWYMQRLRKKRNRR